MGSKKKRNIIKLKPKTVDEIGYKNVFVTCKEPIRGFGATVTDENGEQKQQEVIFNKGYNVVQLPAEQVDAFVAALRNYAGAIIEDVKILDFKK